jgi:TonB family protein
MSLWMMASAVDVAVIALVGVAAAGMLGRQSAALRHWVVGVAVICSWAAIPGVFALQGNVPAARRFRAALPPVTVEYAAASPVTPAPPRSVAEPAPRATSRTEPVVGNRAGFAVAMVWIGGTLVSALVLLIGVTRLRRIAARAEVIRNGPLYEAAQRVAGWYGLSRPIRLLAGRDPGLLIAWGWRRPSVLLPPVVYTWSRERVDIVLAHELAHIARGDWLWQLAAAGLRALYWFNPLVWIAAARLRTESEHACDDKVLSNGVDGDQYATHLLAVARALHHGSDALSLPASAMARPRQLEGRVRAMLNHNANRRPVSRTARFASAGLLVLLTVSVAAIAAQSMYCKVSGTIVDTTGRALPGTTVVLTNTARQSKYEVTSDKSGAFEFVGVQQGPYVLKASLPGFEPFTSPEIQLAGDVQENLKLRVAALQETVTVASNAPAAVVDAATLQQRNDSRTKAAERVQRALAACASVRPAASDAIGGNILAPVHIVLVRPVYPDRPKAAGVSGVVTLNAVIGTDGAIRDVRAISGPDPALEAAAVEAVRQWEFSPTLLNCDAIEVNMRVVVNFTAGR